MQELPMLRIEKVADISPLTEEPDFLGYEWIEIFKFGVMFAPHKTFAVWIQCSVTNNMTASGHQGHSYMAWEDITRAIEIGCYKVTSERLPTGTYWTLASAAREITNFYKLEKTLEDQNKSKHRDRR